MRTHAQPAWSPPPSSAPEGGVLLEPGLLEEKRPALRRSRLAHGSTCFAIRMASTSSSPRRSGPSAGPRARSRAPRRARSRRSLYGKTWSSIFRTPTSRAHSSAASHQRAAGAPAAKSVRDHQAEVGDVPARRMGVARDREAPDDALRRLDDEHRRVRRAADGAQVAPLVGGAPPLAVRDQPALGLGPDRAREIDERRRVPGLGRPDAIPARHATTIPAPPRRGSPAASSRPSSASVTADTPPK